MRTPVLGQAPALVLEIEPAVHDGPGVEVRGERVGGDERLEWHISLVPALLFSLHSGRGITILSPTPMNPTLLVPLALAVLAAVAIYGLRRLSRDPHSQPLDLGVVSTRWLSELRRDEPWGRS
jgi:hypothetical protein